MTKTCQRSGVGEFPTQRHAGYEHRVSTLHGIPEYPCRVSIPRQIAPGRLNFSVAKTIRSKHGMFGVVARPTGLAVIIKAGSEDDMGNGMSASIAAVQAQIEAGLKESSMPSIRPGADIGLPAGDTNSGMGGGFRQMIEAVNTQDHAAAEKMAAVDSGRSDDLVGAMLASQEASLSFSMLMQVRNKVVGAMEDLIKLQL